MRASILRHPFRALALAMVLAFALAATVGDPVRTGAAVAFLLAAALMFSLVGLRLLERAPAGSWRYAYFLLVGGAIWLGIEVVLLGSHIGASATWLSVAVMVCPIVFLVYWFESRWPAAKARATFDAIPGSRLWLIVILALGAMTATLPIENDVVRAPLLMVIVAGAGVAVERTGRAYL